MLLPNRPSSDVSCPNPIPNGNSRALIRAWRLRYVPVRAALVALAAVCLGLWVTCGAVSALPADEIGAYIRGHTSGSDSVIVLWTRLCAAQLPLYVLLFCAGLTRFSGALTNGVLLVCGMADGATLALLWHMASAGTVPTVFCVAFLLRTAAELILRVCMATAACRLARRMDDRECEGAGNDPTFGLLARYVATFVLVVGAVAAVCLGYVALVF